MVVGNADVERANEVDPPGRLDAVLRAARPETTAGVGRSIDLQRLFAIVTGTDEAPPRLGRFEIQAKIGEGGMGAVYRAHDPRLDRAVALKVMRAGLGVDDEERIRKEAKALARLSHPGVVAIYDIGVADGDLYIAMEHVVGGSLTAWLRAHPEPHWRDLGQLFLQAAHGLAAAHRVGIVHRDFKPDNVLVGEDGRVRVADFGVAQLDDDPHDGSAAEKTVLGMVGTPQFMAPEQRRGDSVDARSDQYSFCLSLWRALEPNVEPGAHPPAIPPSLRTILMRGLQRDPDLRWPSMDDLAAALGRILEEHPEDRMRSLLLDRVERFWSTGVLDASLAGREPIDLPIRDVSRRVATSDGMPVRTAGHARRGTSAELSSWLDRANGSLLLLGAPGAGKTTTLLLLARRLVEAARADPAHPAPVVLNLASYGETSGSLQAWILDELVTKYALARSRGRSWLESDALMLLLDGLDEVAPERRRACVEAINAFRLAHPVQIVVACREDDYASIDLPLALGGAVLVEPLDEPTIEAFLRHLEDGGAALRSALEEDAELAAEVRSPFMLAMLAVAGPNVSADPGKLRGELLRHYIDHVFARRRGHEEPYSRERTLEGLRWLARVMRRHEQTELWIERIQADWLEEKWQRVGVIAGSLLAIALLVIGINVLASFIVEGFTRARPMALFIAAATFVSMLAHTRTLRVRPVEALQWSWRLALRRAPYSYGGCLLLVGFIWYTEIFGTSAAWITTGLVLGANTLFSVVRGLASSDEANRIRPNQGILQSVRNALWIGGITAVGTFLFMGAVVFPLIEAATGVEALRAANINPGFAGALETSACLGPILGGVYGGYAATMHGFVRLGVAATSPLPLRLTAFLDHAVERALLRRVGGGYIFLHRMLLDHFADEPEA